MSNAEKKWFYLVPNFFAWCAGSGIVVAAVSGFRIFFGGRGPDDATHLIVAGSFGLLFGAMALWTWLMTNDNG
jgi:hypothetical protein